MKARFGGGAQLHSHGKWPSLMSCSWLCSLPEGKWFELWVSHVFAPLLVRTRLELCQIICEWGMSQRTRGYPANKLMLRKFYNSLNQKFNPFLGFLLSMSIKTQKQWGHIEVPKNLTWNHFKGDPRMILLLAGSGLHWVPCSILDMLGQGLITLSKNCPSVGGVWTPAGRTSVQLANFRGSSMFYPTKSGHPKNAKKRMNWSQFGGHH